MGVQGWTYLLVGITFALYIAIAIWSRVGSTAGFYVAGRGVPAFADVDDPTHAIDSATVTALAKALQGLGESDLRERYDPPAMLTAARSPTRSVQA